MRTPITNLKLCATLVLCFLLTGVFAADYYWVGGSGNWSDHNNHWATTSGGSTFHSQVPTESDNVFFDANSFSSTGQTVTLDADVYCYNMNWNGVTNNPTFSGSREMHIYGSMILSAGMNYTATSDVYFEALTTGHDVNTAGQTLAEVYFNGQQTANGGWDLQSDLNVSGRIDFYAGEFNTNGYDFNCEYFYAWYNTAKDIDFTGSDSLYVGAEWRLYPNGTTTTFDAGTSTIVLDDEDIYYYNQMYFYGGNYTYHNAVFNRTSDETNESYRTYGANINYSNTFNDVTFNIGGERQCYIYDNNTFRNVTANFVGQNSSLGAPRLNVNSTSTISKLITESNSDLTGQVQLYSSSSIDTIHLDEGTGLVLNAGTTTTIDELIANGSCARRIDITTNDNASSTATLSKSSGSVNVSWVTISDVIASGGASFSASDAIALGTTTGWTISSPSGSTLYWVGGSGNWNDNAHWSTSSGGSSGTCGVPTLADNVVFDANSFSSSGQTVTINVNGQCNSMTWTGVTDNPTLAGGQKLTLGGSLTLSANMSFTHTGEFYFNSQSSNTIDLAGHELGRARFSSDNNLSGQWTLQSDFDTDLDIEFTGGKIVSGGYDISARSFNANHSYPRVLDLTGSQYVDVHENWRWNNYQDTLTVDTTTIRMISDPSNAQRSMQFYGGNKTYHNIYVDHNGIYGYQIYFSGSNSINDLEAHMNGYQYIRMYHNNTINNFEVYMDGSYQTTSVPRIYLQNTNDIQRLQTYNTSIYRPEVYLYQNNTFGELNPAAGSILFLGANYTQTVDSLTLVGLCDAPIDVRSTSNGTAGTFSISSGSVNAAYVRLQDNTATGGASFNATDAINNGNVSGWTISSKPATNYY